jgi:hypothetical protein
VIWCYFRKIDYISSKYKIKKERMARFAREKEGVVQICGLRPQI